MVCDKPRGWATNEETNRNKTKKKRGISWASDDENERSRTVERDAGLAMKMKNNPKKQNKKKATKKKKHRMDGRMDGRNV